MLNIRSKPPVEIERKTVTISVAALEEAHIQLMKERLKMTEFLGHMTKRGMPDKALRSVEVSVERMRVIEEEFAYLLGGEHGELAQGKGS